MLQKNFLAWKKFFEQGHTAQAWYARTSRSLCNKFYLKYKHVRQNNDIFKWRHVHFPPAPSGSLVSIQRQHQEVHSDSAQQGPQPDTVRGTDPDTESGRASQVCDLFNFFWSANERNCTVCALRLKWKFSSELPVEQFQALLHLLLFLKPRQNAEKLCQWSILSARCRSRMKLTSGCITWSQLFPDLSPPKAGTVLTPPFWLAHGVTRQQVTSAASTLVYRYVLRCKRAKLREYIFREGRVMGQLEVSRSIGDGPYKNHGVSCVPDVKRCQLCDNDRWVHICAMLKTTRKRKKDAAPSYWIIARNMWTSVSNRQQTPNSDCCRRDSYALEREEEKATERTSWQARKSWMNFFFFQIRAHCVWWSVEEIRQWVGSEIYKQSPGGTIGLSSMRLWETKTLFSFRVEIEICCLFFPAFCIVRCVDATQFLAFLIRPERWKKAPQLLECCLHTGPLARSDGFQEWTGRAVRERLRTTRERGRQETERRQRHRATRRHWQRWTVMTSPSSRTRTQGPVNARCLLRLE